MDDKPKTPVQNDAMDKLKGTTVTIGTQILDMTGKVEADGTDSAKIYGFTLPSFIKPYIGKKLRIVIEELKEV